MKIESILAQIGNRKDDVTGAVSAPIYHSTTYRHPGLGESTGYDYTRTKNPTRHFLEETIAELEGGVRGFSFASGMAAIDCTIRLFRQGDHLIFSDDIYGGTYRLMNQVYNQYGITSSFVDTSHLSAIESAIRKETRAIFVETPTNPLMKISDVEAISSLAKRYGLLTIVDNTFLTPYFQRPLELGADIVVHSATKYLGGHNDVLAGLVVAKNEDIAERLYFAQNSIGSTLGPSDCWLLMRGMKTLALRMERHEQNALALADWLEGHKNVEKVLYPGLSTHQHHDIQARQSQGFGGMLSFYVKDERQVAQILQKIRLISFAESLGGTESMLTYPATQTHADIPADVRNAVGVTDTLLRFSVGLENIEDLIHDLANALEC